MSTYHLSGVCVDYKMTQVQNVGTQYRRSFKAAGGSVDNIDFHLATMTSS
jgi:hypothetical protein